MDFLAKLFGIKYRSGVYYSPRTNKIVILQKGFLSNSFSVEFKHQKIYYVKHSELSILGDAERIGSF